MTQRIIILGGYGNAGQLLVELLLQFSDAQLVLAGRNNSEASRVATRFNTQLKCERVSAITADATDRQSLVKAFQGATLVLVASSTLDYTQTVAEAALEAQVDYFDLLLSTPAKLKTLRDLETEVLKAGLCFITDGGFHPGVPALLVRYAATRFNTLEKAEVGSVIKLDWKEHSLTNATIDEFTAEFDSFKTLTYRNGQWVKRSYSDSRKFDFGSEFGIQSGIAMDMAEMHALPDLIPSLKETGFYVGGFNWFVDYLVMPAGIVALKVFGDKAAHPVGKTMEWGLKNFSKPPFGTILQLEASGQKDNHPADLKIRLSHSDGYILTAIPVVACLLQYLDGSLRKPGLWMQAVAAEPERMLKDMERMGATVEIIET